MTQVTFEELVTRFPLRNIAPYGACLVIPGAEFDPDWEVVLGDAGFSCHFTDFDGKPVTLVQKKVIPEGKVVYVPPVKAVIRARAQGGNNWQKVWTVPEDDLLIALWTRKPRLAVAAIAQEVASKFPKRTVMAVANRVSALQQEGRIQPRFKTKRNSDKAPKEEKVTKSIKSISQPQPTDNKALQALREGYGALSTAFVDLKTEFDRQSTFIHTNLAKNNAAIEELQSGLIRHKHAGASGEAMLPMEASK